MPAYVVVDVEVTDPVRYEEYKQLAPPAIAAYGGRYLARGGRVDTLEGTWAPSRLVIVEFPTAAQAKAWWNCEEYREAKALRHATARSQMIVVEGV
jgi:uncharacterized protein (DUF1330 family)